MNNLERSQTANTLRQRQIVSFLEAFAEGDGPTQQQIATACGMRSIATVSHHLRVLEREGVIEREAIIQRGRFRRRVAVVVRRRG